jgi:invasion protein IalB
MILLKNLIVKMKIKNINKNKVDDGVMYTINFADGVIIQTTVTDNVLKMLEDINELRADMTDDEREEVIDKFISRCAFEFRLKNGKRDVNVDDK